MQILLQGQIYRLWVRLGVMAAILAGSWYFLTHSGATADLPQVPGYLRQIAAWQWCAAFVCITASFCCVGQYDVICHRILKTGITGRRAARSGIAAIAIAQMTGFGGLTAGLVRWWVLRELPMVQVARLTAAVSLSFMMWWAVFAAASAAWLGLVPVFMLVGIIVILMTTATAAIRFRPLETLQFLRLGFWALGDLALLGTALWLLQPVPATTDLATVVPAYLVALGAGLLANTPAGLGIFDFVFLNIASEITPAKGMAMLAAFRVLAYGLPAVFAMLVLCRQALKHGFLIVTPQSQDALPGVAPAVWGLVAQGGQIVTKGARFWYLRRACGFCIALGDPAPARNLAEPIPTNVIYKATARTASRLRKMGWRSALIAQEAQVDLQSWTLAHPRRSGLRRKLRAAARAGLTTRPVDLATDISGCSQIAAEWRAAQGGEKSFSMGHFDPNVLALQRCFVVNHRAEIVCFASFWVHRGRWHLDLMRQSPASPDGAMHLAIVAAITEAKATGANQFSLADVQIRTHLPGLLTRFSDCHAGLRQFKQAFDPRWSPRYLCSRHLVAQNIGIIALALAINRPWQRLIRHRHSVTNRHLPIETLPQTWQATRDASGPEVQCQKGQIDDEYAV